MTVDGVHAPRMWIEEDPSNANHRACMITFYPQFGDDKASLPTVTTPVTTTTTEIVLVLDRSCSMKDEAIEDLKKAASLMLHKLGPATLFNVVDFGSVHTELFPRSVLATSAHVHTALAYIASSNRYFYLFIFNLPTQ